MLPAIFGENMFDEMFDRAFDMDAMFGGKNPLYGKHAKNLMKTDIRETDNTYELDVDLPGFQKDEVQVDKLEAFRAGIDGALGQGACHVLSIRPQGGAEVEA